MFWTNKKFVIFYQLLKLRKIRGKNWGKQNWLFGGLMSRKDSFGKFLLVVLTLLSEQRRRQENDY